MKSIESILIALSLLMTGCNGIDSENKWNSDSRGQKESYAFRLGDTKKEIQESYKNYGRFKKLEKKKLTIIDGPADFVWKYGTSQLAFNDAHRFELIFNGNELKTIILDVHHVRYNLALAKEKLREKLNMINAFFKPARKTEEIVAIEMLAEKIENAKLDRLGVVIGRWQDVEVEVKLILTTIFERENARNRYYIVIQMDQQ